MAKFEFNDFGNSSSAAFLGDFGNREHILAGGAQLDSAASWVVADADIYTITVNDAAAAVGDVALGVAALPVAIPAGTTLNFTGGKYAIVATSAAAAATSLVVEPLGEAIADASTATFNSGAEDEALIPAGTLVGRTIAERAAGDSFGPAGDSDDEVFITVADVDLDQTTDVDLVRHGTLIKVNFLPSYTGASSTVKSKLEAKYQLILG